MTGMNLNSEAWENIVSPTTEEQQAAALNTVMNTLSMESTMDDPIEQGFQASYNLLVSQGFLTLTGKDNFDVFSIWCAEKGYKIYLDSVKKTEEIVQILGTEEERVDVMEYTIKLVDDPLTSEVKTRVENIAKGYQRRHPEEKEFSPKVKDQVDLASILLKAYNTTDSKEASMAFNREWSLCARKKDEVSVKVSHSGTETECSSIKELRDAICQLALSKDDNDVILVTFHKEDDSIGSFFVGKKDIDSRFLR